MPAPVEAYISYFQFHSFRNNESYSGAGCILRNATSELGLGLALNARFTGHGFSYTLWASSQPMNVITRLAGNTLPILAEVRRCIWNAARIQNQAGWLARLCRGFAACRLSTPPEIENPGLSAPSGREKSP